MNSHAGSIFIVESIDEGNNNFGTCFLFFKNYNKSYFVTCAHVIIDCGGYDKIKIDNYPANLLTPRDKLKNIDFAIISIDHIVSEPILELSNSGKLSEQVELIGYHKFQGNFLERTLQGINNEIIHFRFKTHRIKAWNFEVISKYNIQKGYSGSPLFNSDNRVFGVVSHKMGSDQPKDGIAIDIFSALEILKSDLIENCDDDSDMLNYLFDEKSKQLFEQFSVRANEITSLLSQIKDSATTINCLWITGISGSGKTFFTFNLLREIHKEGNYIYIPSNINNDPVKFIELIKESLSDILFRELQEINWNHIDKERIQNRYLEAAINAVTKSDKVLFFENIEDKHLENTESILSLICLKNFSAPNIKIICNSYSINQILPENHFVFNLPKLTYDDAYKICFRINPEIDQIDFKQVYKNFDGHALSIISWAKNKEYKSLGIPSQAIEKIQKIWYTLSEDAQLVFMAVSRDPEIAIPYLLKHESVFELLDKGLLIKYPSKTPKDVFYYIHQIVLDACKNIFSETEQIKATNAIYHKAIVNRLTIFVPKLIENLIIINNEEEINTLLVSFGRELIETISINESRAFLSKVLLNIKSTSEGYFFCKYLEGLLFLFEGNYSDAYTHFNALISERYTDISEYNLAIEFEIIECLRRKGDVKNAIKLFSDIFPSFQECKKTSNILANHFLSVSSFLNGHFFRHFGNYNNSIKYYNQAEKLFLETTNNSNKIEALHCAYSRSILYLVNQQSPIENPLHDSFIENTRSFFLRGLFYLTKSKQEISTSNFEESIKSIEIAKQNFKKFGSISYYQRCICLEALIAEYNNDTLSIINAFKDIPNGKEANHKVFIIKLILNSDSEKLENQNTIINSTIKSFLENGNLLTALSLMIILELRNMWNILTKEKIKVAALIQSESNYKLNYDEYSSYHELKNKYVKTILGKDNINYKDLKQLIFLFD